MFAAVNRLLCALCCVFCLAGIARADGFIVIRDPEQSTTKAQYNLDPPRLSLSLRNTLTTTGRLQGNWTDVQAAINNKGN